MNPWSGYITRVRVYNKVLDQNQIYRRMCYFPAVQNEPGLIGYWLPNTKDFVKYGGRDRSLTNLQNMSPPTGYEDVCWNPALTCAEDVNQFVLWWKFDGGLYDSSSKKDVGRIIGPVNGHDFVDGREGKTLYLTSPHSYVVEDKFSFPSNEYSVCVWFRTSKSSATVLSYISNQNTNTLSIGYYNAGLSIKLNSFIHQAPLSQPLNDNRWHQICVVRKGGSVTFYSDGMDITRVSGDNIATGGSLVIGQNQGCEGGCFEQGQSLEYGFVDDVMIFSRALRPMEVQTLARSEMFCCGLPSSDAEYVCSGRGTCSYPDRCTCDEQEWTGQNCEIPVCFGKAQAESCSGPANGKCTLPNRCECTSGKFTGEECQIPICGGIASSNQNACNGRGMLRLKFVVIIHIAPSINLPFSFLVCIGICTSPDNCICEGGYDSTSFCREPICSGLVNGQQLVCNGHGRCVSPNECLCNDGWTGKNCEKKICHMFPEDHPQVCSGNGNCTNPDFCECNHGYKGQKCQYPICDKVSYEADACSGNGKCTAPDTCDCFSGWTGMLMFAHEQDSRSCDL